MITRSVNSAERDLRSSVDWRLVCLYLVLVLIGWMNIYASTYSPDASNAIDWGARSGKQLIWIGTAFVLGTIILFIINARLWEVISTPAYLILIVLLIAVIFVGGEVKGSKSWFTFGPVSFQPAEISKITTALFLSMIMSRSTFKIGRVRDFLIAAAIIGVPMMIIVAESETGSALVYMGFLFVLYLCGMTGWVLAFVALVILLFILTLVTTPVVAGIVLTVIALVYYLLSIKGTRRRSLFRRNSLFITLAAVAAGAVLIVSTDFVFNNVLQDHQRKRIEVLLGMKEDPSGVGYNVRQSMIAIGSGGFSGKGYLQGTQTTYGFVPEQSTDFIFCTIGEEWGFVGCLAVILLFVALITIIIKDAERSREPFTRIYGYCVASIFFMHLFINIGMTIGLMPVIGIPLPFISYGGSSLWSFTMMLFIFIALDRQERKYF